MEPTLLELSPWRAALLAGIPLLYAVVAVVAAANNARPEIGWRVARCGAALALLAALLSLAGLLAGGAGLHRGPVLAPLGSAGFLYISLRSDALGALMLLLVSFIGWVIAGYSQNYLGGAQGQAARGV